MSGEILLRLFDASAYDVIRPHLDELLTGAEPSDALIEVLRRTRNGLEPSVERFSHLQTKPLERVLAIPHVCPRYYLEPRDLHEVQQALVAVNCFADRGRWALAHSGTSWVVDQHITRALRDRPRYYELFVENAGGAEVVGWGVPEGLRVLGRDELEPLAQELRNAGKDLQRSPAAEANGLALLALIARCHEERRWTIAWEILL